MKKRIICLTLSLCMLFTMLLSVPAFAAEAVKITIPKNTFQRNETIRVIVEGLSDAAIEYGAWFGVIESGETVKDWDGFLEYISEFKADNSYEFTAPDEFGDYEMVVCIDENIIGSVPFTVAPRVAKAGDITLSATEVRLSEKMSVTINGLIDEEIDGVTIHLGSITPEGVSQKLKDTIFMEYVSELPRNNTLEFNAPNEFGKYEIIVAYPDEKNVFGRVVFEVVPGVAGKNDIVLNKTIVKIGEKIKATIQGLKEEEIEQGIWIGIEKVGTKIENTRYMQYVANLPVGNTWEFEAPIDFGQYEVRVIYPDDKTMYGIRTFVVESSKAKEGDLVLTPASAAPGEKMKFTVKGLTEGEIANGAWIGLTKAGTKLENTYCEKWISELPIGDTWEFYAPMEAGTYEIRVFCTSNLNPNEDAEKYEYAMFGYTTFTVSGEPAIIIVDGYEGISGWAVTEVNEAVENGLVTERVLSDFTKEITREEFCELVVKLYEKMTGKTAEPAAKNPFVDTKNPEILKAFNLGIVNGIDMEKGIFAPEYFVTREQIATMIVRALKVIMPQLDVAGAEFTESFHDRHEVSSWAYDNLKFLNHNGIFKGSSGYIFPKANTTREQGIALIKRVFEKFFDI